MPALPAPLGAEIRQARPPASPSAASSATEARAHLLTSGRRPEIPVGRLERHKTLKSPKPLYELTATGRDAETVRRYLGVERSQR